MHPSIVLLKSIPGSWKKLVVVSGQKMSFELAKFQSQSKILRYLGNVFLVSKSSFLGTQLWVFFPASVHPVGMIHYCDSTNSPPLSPSK
jgi:hypothetical protein